MGNTAYTHSQITGVICNGLSASATTSQAVDGTGWVPINFAGLSGGSPIGGLPVDPNPTAIDANPSRYYVYIASATTTNGFELLANLESTYYSSGTTNVESTDGGKITTLYEVGTTFDITATSATCFQYTGY